MALSSEVGTRLSSLLLAWLNEQQPTAAESVVVWTDRLPYAWVRRLLGRPEPWGITLGRTVYLSTDWREDQTISDTDLEAVSILAHERAHVEQWARDGWRMWLRYLTASGRRAIEREATERGLELTERWAKELGLRRYVAIRLEVDDE